jgi:hypothetical protein
LWHLTLPKTTGRTGNTIRAVHVRFGSKADIATSLRHVRFTPKADIAKRDQDVRFVPKGDICIAAKSILAQ